MSTADHPFDPDLVSSLTVGLAIFLSACFTAWMRTRNPVYIQM